MYRYTESRPPRSGMSKEGQGEEGSCRDKSTVSMELKSCLDGDSPSCMCAMGRADLT